MLCRDDEQRTGLMLAAVEGHIPVMKILLDNHAAVNDRDKMKVRVAGCFSSLTPVVEFLCRLVFIYDDFC